MTANPHDPVASGNTSKLDANDPDRIGKIVAALETAHQGLKAILDTVQTDQWEMQVQSADQRWTVRQLLIHLVSAQRDMTAEMTAWQAGQDPVTPDFDVHRWNRRNVEKSNDKTPETLLSELQSGHEVLTRLVNSLLPDDLEKTGRHGDLQILTVEQLGHLVASHEALHTAEIAQKLATG